MARGIHVGGLEEAAADRVDRAEFASHVKHGLAALHASAKGRDFAESLQIRRGRFCFREDQATIRIGSRAA